MSSIRHGIFMMGLLAVIGTGCGPGAPASEQPPATEQAPTADQPQAIPGQYLPSGEVQSQATGYGCCALCNNRVDYHLLWWVSSGCTAEATAWCNEPGKGRGGLWDAAWTTCRDDVW
jgi:hypothetical protein